jgi:hypothetical protein
MSNSLVNVKKNEKESNHIKIVTENKIAYASDNVEVERNEVIWRIKQLIFDENVKLFYIVCAYLIFSSLFFFKKKTSMYKYFEVYEYLFYIQVKY